MTGWVVDKGVAGSPVELARLDEEKCIQALKGTGHTG